MSTTPQQRRPWTTLLWTTPPWTALGVGAGRGCGAKPRMSDDWDGSEPLRRRRNGLGCGENTTRNDEGLSSFLCEVVVHVVGSRRPGKVMANALSACFHPWVRVPSSPSLLFPMLRIAK